MAFFKHASFLVSAIAAIALTACGGGGGGSSSSANSGSSGAATLNYTPGVFAAESGFKDRCRIPRPGSSDTTGSTTQENFWIRSWSNRTYLWYDEITDRNPASFSDREAYFETQKTTATTASGTPKDQFHFTQPTDEYQQSVSAGAARGYGARFLLLSPAAPRDVRIAYVEPGSPADAAGFVRGARVLTADGVSVSTGAAGVLNAAFFPQTSGESHTFTIRAPGGDNQDITVRSAIVTQSPVLRSEVIESETGPKVGYVVFNTFGTASAEQALFDAFTDLETADVDELILDLRYNGGGFLTIAAQLGYMVAGDANTNGRTFERLQFNNKFPATDPVTGQTLRPSPFVKTGQDFSVTAGRALPSLDLDRVYILTGDGTCSASESLINGLRGVNVDVVLIGTTTCGKPYGFYPTDNCGLTYFTVQFEGVNERGFGDYADGFTPQTNGPTAAGAPVAGCFVSDDLSRELGDENEGQLSAALTYIETGACPPVRLSAAGTADKAGEDAGNPQTSLLNDPRVQQRLWAEQSRLVRGER